MLAESLALQLTGRYVHSFIAIDGAAVELVLGRDLANEISSASSGK